MRKAWRIPVLILAACFIAPVADAAGAGEKPVFGPVRYDVKERYGTENVSTAAFRAGEGTYVIKLQNGDQGTERPDVLELVLNGQKVLKEGTYGHRIIACFVKLQKENSLVLTLKDFKPTGFRRPPATPKFSTITVLPARDASLQGAFGAATWEDIAALIAGIKKIKGQEAASLAGAAADLRNDVALRTESVRKLSDLKEASARDFFLRLYGDGADNSDVRAEAALAVGTLGDAKNIPVLMRGLIDPDEKIRLGSARALSFYKEEDTKGQLTAMLGTLDSMRKEALMRTLASAGWKPVGALIDLARSTDPHVAAMAIEMLGGLRDPRAVDALLALLGAAPGPRDKKAIITALGESRDQRAFEPLFQMAGDEAQRSGYEAELAAALASIGDQRAAGVIAGMIKKSKSDHLTAQLKAAYKKLTSKDY